MARLCTPSSRWAADTRGRELLLSVKALQYINCDITMIAVLRLRAALTQLWSVWWGCNSSLPHHPKIHLQETATLSYVVCFHKVKASLSLSWRFTHLSLPHRETHLATTAKSCWSCVEASKRNIRGTAAPSPPHRPHQGPFFLLTSSIRLILFSSMAFTFHWLTTVPCFTVCNTN